MNVLAWYRAKLTDIDSFFVEWKHRRLPLEVSLSIDELFAIWLDTEDNEEAWEHIKRRIDDSRATARSQKRQEA